MLGFLGFSGDEGGGGLSEFVALDERMLYPLPDTVSIDFAALIEPLAVAHHAIKTINTKIEGLDVLIVGGGPVGYALACALRAENVKSILVSEPTLKRRDQAKAVVDKVIDPRSENVGEVCRSFTGGKGADLVFDCAGIQVGLDAAFDAIVRGGYFVNVAVWETPVKIPENQAQAVSVTNLV
jgi:threonine dehydrogenase-like Zn-dependent dehydrogenase